MTDEPRERPSLKDFDAYADRNGQDLGQDEARDVGRPARLQGELKGNPMGEAETARIASGTPGSDATDETEAETAQADLDRIGNAAQSHAAPSGAAAEAIERATAPNGKDAGGVAMPNDHIPIVGTRKPDDDVGAPGAPAAAGGRQSAEQSAITEQGSGGKTDADRNADWDGAPEGRNPAPAGGSSDGQSDRPRSPTPPEKE